MKKHKAPGKSDRKSISLLELADLFPTEQAAVEWFESLRWPAGTQCPHCNSMNVAVRESGKPMRWHCRDCRKYFSVRTGMVMAQSRIPVRKWAFAIYLHATSLKSVSSMKLHRDLRITQKSAWFMAHRIREAMASTGGGLLGPLEVDESYYGCGCRPHDREAAHLSAVDRPVIPEIQSPPLPLKLTPANLALSLMRPAAGEDRPRLLDLFCCAGGSAAGYWRAGFDIVGVDIDPQPRYPFPFIRADVMALDADFLAGFDAIHASPPCQAYSDLAARNGNGHEHPDLVGPVRTMLQATGLPYVIENVDGAPLKDYIILCGTMFKGLRVLRHRLFESNVPLSAPSPCNPHPLCHTFDKRKAHYGKTDEWTDFVSVNGGGNCSVAAASDAMGIDWMTKNELNEAIPPAYTQWVGKTLFEHVLQCRAA